MTARPMIRQIDQQKEERGMTPVDWFFIGFIFAFLILAWAEKK